MAPMAIETSCAGDIGLEDIKVKPEMTLSALVRQQGSGLVSEQLLLSELQDVRQLLVQDVQCFLLVVTNCFTYCADHETRLVNHFFGYVGILFQIVPEGAA